MTQTDSEGRFALSPPPNPLVVYFLAPSGCKEKAASFVATNSTVQLDPWISMDRDPQSASLEKLVKDQSCSVPDLYEWLHLAAHDSSIPEQYRAHGFIPGPFNDPRGTAQRELIRRGTNAWPAVPLLVETLLKADYPSQFGAAWVLSRLHAENSAEWARVKGSLANRVEPVKALIGLSYGEISEYRMETSPEMQRFALRAFKEIGPAAKPAVSRMVALSADESEETRRLAYEALGVLGAAGAEAVPVLEKRLADPQEYPAIRLAAGLTLSKIAPASPAPLQVFRQGLRDERAVMQVCSAEGLCALGVDSAEYFGVVTNGLNHKLASVRCSALRTLAHLGTKARPARESVEKLKTDADKNVREAAILTLKAIDSAQSPR